MDSKSYLLTGGAGFIGANFIHHALAMRPRWNIVNLDALTYAGNLASLEGMSSLKQERHQFVHGDICDTFLLQWLFKEHEFDGVVHLAAESHVDRSILGPEAFIRTNILGTFWLLQVSLEYRQRSGRGEDFRFLHVSTDEVYGSLGPEGHFSEKSSYDPSSPYSASKAAADHLVMAYYRTYGLPVLITNCSNNYGPYQFPEKLIPLMILSIVEGKHLPVYGDGRNVRDWLYVIDHCEALIEVLEKGRPGETYSIGGGEEKENIEIIHLLCHILDALLHRSGEEASHRLICFVPDRPGHDRRYAIDTSKIFREFGWKPRHRFGEALEATVEWYLSHMD